MRVGVCLFVKNEARDLAEWLAYQHVVGFDTVIAYDNDSTDATLEILQAAAGVQDVRVVEWGPGSKRAQMDVYDHCIKTFGPEFDWIAFFDADEFLVPRTGGVKDLLAPMDQVSALVVNWAMFGSSGHVDYPEGLVIEAFTHRSNHGELQVKSIIRPDKIAGALINPHRFPVSGPEVRRDGSTPVWLPPKFATATVDYSACQLNHYFTRSRRHWQDRIEKGWLGRQKWKLEHFDHMDFRAVEDDCAVQFAPAVKAQMERFGVPLRHRPASVIQP